MKATQSQIWLGSALTVDQVLNIELVEPPTDGAVISPLLILGLLAAVVILPRLGKS